ncbi:MAG TPA: hypothetical protein VIF57_31180 [Polyangia bacterium]
MVYAGTRRIRWTTLVRCAWAGLALVAATAPAPARGQAADAEADATAPITLVDPATAPFSSDDLTQALLARLIPTEEGAPGVRISAAADGAVTVEVGERSRLVELGGRSGPAAARVVALVIAELMTSDPSPGPVVNAAPETSAAREAPAPPAAAAALRTAARQPGPSAPARAPRLCVTAGFAKELGAEPTPTGTLDADVVVPLGDSGLLLAPSAGLVLMPTRHGGTVEELWYVGGLGRLLAGVRLGLVDLAGGPFLAPYNIGGATAHTGVLFGGEALARLALPLSPRARLIVTTRLHAYSNRVRVWWLDGRSYTTPARELTIGAGLAWDWAS